MIIRKQQLALMQAARNDEFARLIISKLKTEYPDRVELQDEGIIPRVVALIDKARQYGLTTDRELRAFIVLDLLIAENWDKFPRVSEILGNSRVDEATRFEYILFRLDQEEWTAIRQWSSRARA